MSYKGVMDGKHSFYCDWVDLKGDGSIILYKRADRKRPKYMARFKVPGHKGYILRSTKTEDLQTATRLSERMYFEFESRVEEGLPVKAYTFEMLFNEWKPRYLRMSLNSDRTKRYVTEVPETIERHFLPFARNTLITLINEKFFENYIEWRSREGVTRPSGSTYHYERTVLNKILNYAVREGYLKNQPTFKIPPNRPQPRPDISLSDYRKIIRGMSKDLSNSGGIRIYRSRLYLHQYILILTNTGVRKGEAKGIKWSDIRPVKDTDGTDTVIISVTGKTGARMVVSNPSTVGFLKRLYEYRTKEIGSPPPRDELVFCKHNGTPLGDLKKQFSRFLDSTGTLYADGQKRSIYSLRHTYITMRLSHGAPIYFLAMNCGTSVEMIEKFYGKKRVSDPKIISQITQLSVPQKNEEFDLSFLS